MKKSVLLLTLFAFLMALNLQAQPLPRPTRPIPLPLPPVNINFCVVTPNSYPCVLGKFGLKERDEQLAPSFQNNAVGNALKVLTVFSIFGSPTPEVALHTSNAQKTVLDSSAEAYNLVQDAINKLPAQFDTEKEYLSQLVSGLNLSPEVKSNFYLGLLTADVRANLSTDETAASKLSALEQAEVYTNDKVKFENAVSKSMTLNLSPVAKQVVLKRYEAIDGDAARRVSVARGVVIVPNRRIVLPTRPIN